MAADDGIKPRWAELGQMDRAALRVAWTEAFDHALPHFLSVIFMPKALIWQEQCKQFGDLTPDLKRASRAAATENQVRAQVPQIRTGTQLVRAWNGRRYRVDVTSDGFRMNGGHFRVAVCHRIADHRHHLVRAKVLRSERSGGSGS